jgi:hypothetical protein
MSATAAREITAGGVCLKIDYRQSGGDRGPSVRVYADVDGRPAQLLRFDCFEQDPHYHYAPEGEDDLRKLDPVEVPDPRPARRQPGVDDPHRRVRECGRPCRPGCGGGCRLRGRSGDRRGVPRRFELTGPC